MAKAALQAIRPETERILNPNQSGFTTERSTSDNLRILEGIRARKGTKWVALLDLVKAYDSVDWALLMDKLSALQKRTTSTPEWPFQLIRAVYAAPCQTRIRVAEGLTDPITLGKGVRQGDRPPIPHALQHLHRRPSLHPRPTRWLRSEGPAGAGHA